jgi:hypothetical protein
VAWFAVSGGKSTMELSKPQTKTNWAVFVWAIISLYAGIDLAAYLWLIRLYGFSRVRSEHLHFTSMPKGGAWIVSNGDHITKGFFLNHFLFALILWFAIFSPVLFIFRDKGKKRSS